VVCTTRVQRRSPLAVCVQHRSPLTARRSHWDSVRASAPGALCGDSLRRRRTGIRPEDISALVRDLVLRHGGHGEAAVSDGGAGAWANAFPGAHSQAPPMPPRIDTQVACAR
jgi:hypothetical protein